VGKHNVPILHSIRVLKRITWLILYIHVRSFEIEYIYNEHQFTIIMASEDIAIPIQLVLGSQSVIEREGLTAVPYHFTLSNEGKWEMFISAENIEVKKGEVEEISIQEVIIPENSVALPCVFCHHALGVVLKAKHMGVALVETRRKITSVIFLPIQDGMIEKGDLLAVINVFPIIMNK
jgi:hypothetical protein